MVTVSSLASDATGTRSCDAHGRGHVRAPSNKTIVAGNDSLLGMVNSGHVKTGDSFFSHPARVESNGGDGKI
jgi:hypothetical protein